MHLVISNICERVVVVLNEQVIVDLSHKKVTKFELSHIKEIKVLLKQPPYVSFEEGVSENFLPYLCNIFYQNHDMESAEFALNGVSYHFVTRWMTTRFI